MRKNIFLIGLCTLLFCVFSCKKDSENKNEEPIPNPIDSTQNGIDFGKMDMVLVPSGIFSMGNNAGLFGDEKPAHSVVLDSFYIGKYEVTQALWKDIMNANPSLDKGDSLPVENITWLEVQNFLTKLNEKTGLNYRLPTEAEWEFAARGGNQNHDYTYCGSNNALDVAWHKVNSGNKTHPVGLKNGNELGIYDMSGNVWEWCSDWYGSTYYSTSPQSNPKGPASGDQKITRGGSFSSDSTNIRNTCRFFALPNSGGVFIGFRLAHDIKKTQ